jgi:hypothetical protein
LTGKYPHQTVRPAYFYLYRCKTAADFYVPGYVEHVWMNSGFDKLTTVRPCSDPLTVRYQRNLQAKRLFQQLVREPHLPLKVSTLKQKG